MPSTTIAADPVTEFAADVRAGLTRTGQKELPSKYLYDTLGSKLFEAICELPEYGLTRADERILKRYAPDIAHRIPGDVMVCELGSGNGRKTRCLLEALSSRRRINYYPIEISHSALAMCERELGDIESVGIVGLEREYLDGLREAASLRKRGQRVLALFLGSTIGNFSHPYDRSFLAEIRSILDSGDLLLLGADLLKPADQLVKAYDDPLGVTAAFNLNLLARINRELEADFALPRFEHVAKFNAKTCSVEMHLRSRQRQTATIRKAGLFVTFDENETIWTENSHKYSREELRSMAEEAGFRIETQWIDAIWPFAETLMSA